jgi:hypothetical protein
MKHDISDAFESEETVTGLYLGISEVFDGDMA